MSVPYEGSEGENLTRFQAGDLSHPFLLTMGTRVRNNDHGGLLLVSSTFTAR